MTRRKQKILIGSLILCCFLFSFAFLQIGKPQSFAENDEQQATLCTLESAGLTDELFPSLSTTVFDAYHEIPLTFSLHTTREVQSVQSSAEGFSILQEPVCSNGNIQAKVAFNEETSSPKLTVTVMLTDGSLLQASVYGVVENKKLYLNGNSFWGAKDVYWAEMLDQGLVTEDEYALYLKNISAGSVSEDDIVTEPASSGTSITPMAANDTKVTGRLQWIDDWGEYHPLQKAKVVVMDQGGGLFGWWDVELGTAYTNNFGSFTLSFENRNGGRNLYLKIYPENEYTAVRTGSGNEYVYTSSIRSAVATGSTTTINISFNMSSKLGQSFQILQATTVAAGYAQAMNGSTIDPVTIRYPHNEDSSGCFYRNGTIYIRDTTDVTKETPVYETGQILHAYASWDAIQHEYFHHVQDKLGITANPGGWHEINTNMYNHYRSHNGGPSGYGTCNSSCPKPPAGKEKEYAIKLAYAEAIPSVLAGMAQKYYIDRAALDSNIKTIGDTVYKSYRVSFLNLNNNNSQTEANESAVMGALWDIYDDDSEYYDELTVGASDFWDIMVYNQNKTFSEFVSSFYELYPSKADALGDILVHFGMASDPLPTALDIKERPTFTWNDNGVTNYKTNRFVIVFFNSVKNEIFRSSELTSPSYKLTAIQWNNILQAYGSSFYVQIESYQKDSSGLTTGPYLSDKVSFAKPVPEAIVVGTSQSGSISVGYDYNWYKFTALSSGVYSFYTEGTTDTVGEMFPDYFNGTGTTGRLAYDNDSGVDTNFNLTYTLSYRQTVYIRVRAYSNKTGDYEFCVSFDQHIHNYKASYTPYEDDLGYHKCSCDCGLYILEEHEYVTVGTRTQCRLCRYNGTPPPGTEISSVGDESKETELQEAEIVVPKKFGE